MEFMEEDDNLPLTRVPHPGKLHFDQSPKAPSRLARE
jgi:hypothetical protein